MTLQTYVGQGAVLIDEALAPLGGRLQNNTRLSVCFANEYVAIMEVTLPDGVHLESGVEHVVTVRLITDRILLTGEDYEIRDPLKSIGRLRLIEVSLE